MADCATLEAETATPEVECRNATVSLGPNGTATLNPADLLKVEYQLCGNRV
jgi:hypothetical protein